MSESNAVSSSETPSNVRAEIEKNLQMARENPVPERKIAYSLFAIAMLLNEETKIGGAFGPKRWVGGPR